MKIADSHRSGPGYAMALVVLVILTIGLVYSLWRHTERLFLDDRIPGQSTRGDPGDPVTAASNKTDDSHLIPGWHLFGVVPTGKAPDPKPAEAPKTGLNLKLKGVLSSDDTAGSRAIILVPGKPENSYRTGDQLPGGASIAKIRSESVLLKRSGRFETLPLDKLSSDGEDREGAGQPEPGAAQRTIGSVPVPVAIPPRR